MDEITADQGVRLLHAWGLPEWPSEADARYFLWSNCCVFAIMTNDEGGIDGHMAMLPEKRRYSRDACKAFIDMFGHYAIRVPVLADHRHARNVVRKVGFTEYPPEMATLITGETVEIIYLRRQADGRSNQRDH